ncbi:hypothetical protein C8R47DRAFT_142441 [Mycena vitilis]|nr:hypothetical protein C8R47DRAFT_142441 [Mycena vitilis]
MNLSVAPLYVLSNARRTSSHNLGVLYTLSLSSSRNIIFSKCMMKCVIMSALSPTYLNTALSDFKSRLVDLQVSFDFFLPIQLSQIQIFPHCYLRRFSRHFACLFVFTFIDPVTRSPPRSGITGGVSSSPGKCCSVWHVFNSTDQKTDFTAGDGDMNLEVSSVRSNLELSPQCCQSSERRSCAGCPVQRKGRSGKVNLQTGAPLQLRSS